MFRVKQILAAFLLSLISVFGYTPPVYAVDSSSDNYSVSEVNIGGGGLLHVCSSAYCAKQSAGETAVGGSSSPNYQAQGGFNKDSEPVLEVAMSNTPIDLGVLDAVTTKSGSVAFSVRTFPAQGYNVIVAGTSLKNKSGGHVLAPMGTMAPSQPGLEQFGINLRQNTTPAVGGEPQHIPDSTFAFGAAAAGYATQNNYKFVSGDTIAQSLKGTGQTNYTISVIANVSTSTPAGIYGGRFELIAVPTF